MSDPPKIDKALAALLRGDVAVVMDIALKNLQTLENGPPLMREAFTAGLALGRAESTGEAPPSQVLAFLKFLAAAPVAPEGFRALREGLGITQSAVGELCAVSHTTVSDWELGKRPLPAEAIRALVELAAARAPAMMAPLTGNDVVNLRRKLGMRQIDFAKAIGVSKPAIKQWEQCRHDPIPVTATRRVREYAEREKILLSAEAA